MVEEYESAWAVIQAHLLLYLSSHSMPSDCHISEESGQYAFYRVFTRLLCLAYGFIIFEICSYFWFLVGTPHNPPPSCYIINTEEYKATQARARSQFRAHTHARTHKCALPFYAASAVPTNWRPLKQICRFALVKTREMTLKLRNFNFTDKISNAWEQWAKH